MDREALALRNRRMAEAFHAMPLKHHIRRGILELVAHTPLPSSKRQPVRRILLIRPDHLGDVLLTTPAIYALRTAAPDAELHALVGPWSAEVIAGYPEIDTVLTLPFPAFSRRPGGNWRSPYELAVRSARYLRRIGYDSAIIFRPDHWWGALLAKLAGISHRVGYDLPDVAPFLTHPVAHQHMHAVMQSLRLVESWTGTIVPENAIYHFPIDPLDRAYMDGYLREWGITPEQRIVCIHPGAGTRVKQWEEERWATVADTLHQQFDAPVIFTGSDQEQLLAQRIAAQMKHVACITAGDTRVGQLAALFARASVVLGPDSGPLHLAAAVGTPTVALFGPADPVEFSPWGPSDRHVVLTSNIGCRPCRVLDWGSDDPKFHPCVRDITVAHVLEAVHRAASQG